MEKITKGEVQVFYTAHTKGSYLKIQVPQGETVCNITTRNEERAHGNARLIADALNTYNTCQTLPSELLEQNRELIEALTKLFDKSIDLFNHCVDQHWIDPEEDPTEGTLEMETAFKNTGQLLQKIQQQK